MNKITFLLGAGASANSIPLVMEIPQHLALYRYYLKEHLGSYNISEYLVDVEDLENELNEYNTIDSYAKTLTQNKVNAINKIKLKKLKSILCGLFMFQQLKKKKDFTNLNEYLVPYSNKVFRTIDPRYKSFFAKVLSDDKLDERINIISWNYDLQLEIGLENNLGYKYEELQNSCRIYPHPSCEMTKTNTYNWTNPYDTPQIVKLNGTAGIFLRSEGFYNIYLDQNETFEDQIDTLLEIHKEVNRYHKYTPFLRFAWEQDEDSKKAINYAKSIISQTQTLVVVGYSFPDFNRSVDREIFQSSNINEIYLQLPQVDFEIVSYNMQASFRNVRNVQLRSNLNEFFIPHQF